LETWHWNFGDERRSGGRHAVYLGTKNIKEERRNVFAIVVVGGTSLNFNSAIEYDLQHIDQACDGIDRCTKCLVGYCGAVATVHLHSVHDSGIGASILDCRLECNHTRRKSGFASDPRMVSFFRK
jgi:hypothetical protein